MIRNIFRRRRSAARTVSKSFEVETVVTEPVPPTDLSRESAAPAALVSDGPVVPAAEQLEPVRKPDSVKVAEALERQLFALYDEENRPDIVWTEDGPQYGDTYDDGDDPALQQQIRRVEKALDDHIAAHRDELATHPDWADKAAAENYYSGTESEDELVADEAEEVGR